MRVLFITSNTILEALQSTVVMERLLADHPHAKIDVIAGTHTRELFENMPGLVRLIALPDAGPWRDYVRVVSRLWRTSYDQVFDTRASFLPTLLRARKVKRLNPLNKAHWSKAYQRMWPSSRTAAYGVWVKPRFHEITHTVAEAMPRPLIALAPAASWHGGMWSARSYAELINQLLATPMFKDASFLLVGRKKNAGADDLASLVPPERCVNLIGQASLAESYAWLCHADLFIGHEGVWPHLAAAASTPTITLFAGGDETIQTPLHPHAQVVVAPNRPRRKMNTSLLLKPRIMSDITVDQVFTATTQLWQTLHPGTATTQQGAAA